MTFWQTVWACALGVSFDRLAHTFMKFIYLVVTA